VDGPLSRVGHVRAGAGAVFSGGGAGAVVILISSAPGLIVGLSCWLQSKLNG
jgi:hypothetical protein